jgi:hypothetical protein
MGLLHAAVVSGHVGPFEATFCLEDCVMSEKLFSGLRHIGTSYPRLPDPLPVFSIVKCKGSMNIPFPVWDSATGVFEDWAARIEEIEAISKARPWYRRREQAVFRGGQRTCTYGRGTPNALPGLETPPTDPRWKQCGRTALLYNALSSDFPRLFNVSLSDGYDFSAVLPRPAAAPQRLTQEEQEDFRFVIYAEGHCQWANRLHNLLFMGAAILFQDTQCIEPFGMLLRPFVHYIPVDYTFSNLTAAMLWARSHTAEVRRIIRAQHRYAKRYVTPQAVRLYVQGLMTEYSKLMTYKVIPRYPAATETFLWRAG